MHLPKPSEGGEFTPPPTGAHPAVCYRFVDLGTQTTNFNGETKHQHKVMLSWEITDPDLRMEDGKPFTISSRYTWSMHEKATLRKTLESWRGVAFQDSDFGPDGFNVKKLIGAPCLLSIIQVDKEGKTYANISAIMKMPKGMTPGDLVNEPVFFSLEDFDRELFSKFSESLQNVIKASPEYQALGRPHQPDTYTAPTFEGESVGMEDIPF